MTIKQKILAGRFNKTKVKAMLRALKKHKTTLNHEKNGLIGWDRDVFITMNNFTGINEDIKTGELILATWIELENQNLI